MADNDDLTWLFTSNDGRTPEGEVLDIMDDLANRVYPVVPVDLLWRAFVERLPDPDAMAREYLESAGFFAKTRCIGGEDAGRCLVLAVAYCVKARAVWCDGDPAGAWAHAAAAARWHGAFGALYLVACHEEAQKVEFRKEFARAAAKARIAGDPKTAAKAEALALWIERKNGKHPRLGTVEQFATEVMRRWPVLTSSKVICGWSTEWEKQVKAGESPTV